MRETEVAGMRESERKLFERLNASIADESASLRAKRKERRELLAEVAARLQADTELRQRLVGAVVLAAVSADPPPPWAPVVSRVVVAGLEKADREFVAAAPDIPAVLAAALAPKPASAPAASSASAVRPGTSAARPPARPNAPGHNRPAGAAS